MPSFYQRAVDLNERPSRFREVDQGRRQFTLQAKRVPPVDVGAGLVVSGGLFEIDAEMPKAVRDFIDQNGDRTIERVMACRVPLASTVSAVVNAVTLGKLNEMKAKNKYESYFHAYLALKLSGNNQNVLLEKNERVYVKFDNGVTTSKGSQCEPARVPANLTVKEFFHNIANSYIGKRIWKYDVITDNCQNFVRDSLLVNNMLTPELSKFIMQDVNGIIKSDGFLHKIGTTVTNLAAKINKKVRGGADLPLTPNARRLLRDSDILKVRPDILKRARLSVLKSGGTKIGSEDLLSNI